MYALQPSPTPNPTEALPVEAARQIMENGVLLGIATLAILAGLIALWAFVVWWHKKIATPAQATEDEPPKCASCAYAQDFRTISELSQHRVFGVIRMALTSIIPRLPVEEAGRKLVFQDLLSVKFKAIETGMTNWLRDHRTDIEDMPSEILQGSILAMLAGIIDVYETELLRSGMPFVVLEVFRRWHGERVDYLRQECQMICESDWINSNVERVGMCFSMVEHVLRTTMFDAEVAMTNLNGQLTGKTYKGVLIGECPPRRRKIGESGINRDGLLVDSAYGY